MVKTGDVLEHPVTGEKVVFRKTAHDTGGELVQADFYLPPGGFVAAEHIHPLQEERFEVVSGRLRGRVAGKELIAGPGEKVVVPAGTPTGTNTSLAIETPDAFHDQVDIAINP